MLTLESKQLSYTPLFCEENIWKLLESIYSSEELKHEIYPKDVLFVINSNETIALYDQQLSKQGSAVIWDYHVILHINHKGNNYILDFDSKCPFPCLLGDYFINTFPEEAEVPRQYQPYLKAIPAKDYFDHFNSDRSHMLGIIPDDAFPQYKPVLQASNKEFSLRELRRFSSQKHTICLPSEYLKQHVRCK